MRCETYNNEVSILFLKKITLSPFKLLQFYRTHLT